MKSDGQILRRRERWNGTSPIPKDAPPASTLVGVQSLALADYLVEIEAVAATE